MIRKSQKLIVAAAVGTLYLSLSIVPVHAKSYITVDDASAEDIVAGMSMKASRGIANIATGWLEFPKQIYTTFHDDGAPKGILVGPFMGIGMTIARTVAGALELVTFYLAYPGFYDSYMDPPFVWQNVPTDD